MENSCCIKLKMFMILLILSLYFTNINSLGTCENCIPLSQCASASQLISRDRSKKTVDILRKSLCGFVTGVRQPKICCDDFDSLEIGDGLSTNVTLSEHQNVNLLPTDCGYITSSRLLGGYRVWDDEFPWVVRIAYIEFGSYAFQCTGTLINSRYVLTSADCIMGRRIAGVRVGARNQRLGCTDTHCRRDVQDIQVSEQITHPEYARNSRTLNNLGLLRLRKPVDLSKEKAGVICLPVNDEHRERNITGAFGTVSQWAENQIEIQLKFPLSISTIQRCEHYTGKHVNDRRGLLNNSICAQRDAPNHCESVPGSPLMLEGLYFNNYKYLQYGILITAKTDCGPEIYTDVAKYMKWILDTIKP